MELKYDPNAKPLTDAEIYKFLPREFKIACHTIKVIVEDWIPTKNPKAEDSCYGQWHDVHCTVKVARAVKTEDDEVIPLNEEQIKNTFWHEVFHCFFFFGSIGQDEMIVQALANFMREYETTKK